MYLDLLDNLQVNKKMMKIVGIETAVYWAEISSILKHVLKKHTCDEQGFFPVDRAYIERETTLTPSKQLECDRILHYYGIALLHPEDPNKLSISVSGMIALVTDENISDLQSVIKETKKSATDKAEAKARGLKFNLRNIIVETDSELKEAYGVWIDSMIDANNCRFTKAVVNLFVETVRKYTADRDAQLRIIKIATINTYKDASWAINLYERESKPKFTTPKNLSAGTKLGEQKVGSAVNSDVSF